MEKKGYSQSAQSGRGESGAGINTNKNVSQ